MISAARTRAIYRSLLRELPPRPLLSSPRTPVHELIRSRLASASPSSPATAATEAQASQLISYLRAQREYVTLIERYNPGMMMDTEERVRLTARKVGMDLPKEFK
ncbi:uncharacterized protein BROUX77_006410 [Berkeleyomyces rouxiae]|uniref:uncharacterized protein n=1 Tax=Berkeleyomyces rouxiae TaxID=2035830 RepID=UPI003B7A808B